MQIDESILETINANKNANSTGTVSNYITDETTVPNYRQGCSFRLPCGICTRTNSMCLLNAMTVYPTWTVSTGTSTMSAEEWKKHYGVTNMCEVKP